MKTYLEARQERYQRNMAALFNLADAVIFEDPKVKVYYHKGQSLVDGLVFIKGETINAVQFHEVPYRWSGSGFGEHSNSTHDLEMPFSVSDVLDNFKPITTVNLTYKEKFKNIEQYLKWCSYLTQYKP